MQGGGGPDSPANAHDVSILQGTVDASLLLTERRITLIQVPSSTRGGLVQSSAAIPPIARWAKRKSPAANHDPREATKCTLVDGTPLPLRHSI